MRAANSERLTDSFVCKSLILGACRTRSGARAERHSSQTAGELVENELTAGVLGTKFWVPIVWGSFLQQQNKECKELPPCTSVFCAPRFVLCWCGMKSTPEKVCVHMSALSRIATYIHVSTLVVWTRSVAIDADGDDTNLKNGRLERGHGCCSADV